jgi:branched-chain amino acid transport system permease protein
VTVDPASAITIVSIYVIMATSLYLPMVVGDLFLLPIGTMGFAAYTYGFLSLQGRPTPLCIAGALAVSLVVGAVVGWLVLRLRGLGSALVTLGVIEIITVFFQNFDPFGGVQGMTGIRAVGSMPVAAGLALLIVAGVAFLETGRRGNIIHAIEHDPLAVECIGVPTKTVRFGMNVASALISAVAGVLLAGYVTYVSPDDFSLGALTRYLMATMMGGSTTVAGPVVGGVIAGGVPQYLQFLQGYQLLVFSAFVIVLLLVRKQGLITRRDLQRLFGRRKQHAPTSAIGAFEASRGFTLRADGIGKSFGGLRVLDDVSFRAVPGTVLGIIGPNGAGKTTLLNVLSGVIASDRGTISLDDVQLIAREPHVAVKRGISRTFQNLRLFAGLTVEENLTVVDPSRAQALLRMAGLYEVRDSFARSLPYGQQRRLEIARALALRPRVLLLDEPTAGMTHEESEEIAHIVNRLKGGGLTVILVEHNIPFLTSIADELVVLDAGRVIARGSCAEALSDPAVIEAYLGKPMVASAVVGNALAAWTASPSG